jgi:outer membrane immunogenic protein
VATMSKRIRGLAAVTAIWAIVALWAPTAGAQAGVPSGVYNWSGFYIGANVGGAAKQQRSSLSIENNNPNNYFNPAAIPGVEKTGSLNLDDLFVTAGGQAGYNRQYGRFVLGVELDFNWLDLSARRSGTFRYTTDNSPYNLTVSDSTDWLLTARPRVGWAIDRWLFYLTTGIAASHSEFKQTFSEPPFTPNPESVSISRTTVGWVVGTGIEFALGRNLSAKAEYLYARFGGTDVVGRLDGADGQSAAPGPVDGAKFTNALSPLELHLFRVGVNYHFH